MADRHIECKAAEGYARGYALAERLIDELPADPGCVEGAVDALLARYYRGALQTRLRLATELTNYVVKTLPCPFTQSTAMCKDGVDE